MFLAISRGNDADATGPALDSVAITPSYVSENCSNQIIVPGDNFRTFEDASMCWCDVLDLEFGQQLIEPLYQMLRIGGGKPRVFCEYMGLGGSNRRHVVCNRVDYDAALAGIQR